MRADLLIHALMLELRALQRDAGRCADAAISDALLRPVEEGFSNGMALAEQIVSLRQRLDGVISMLEPEALDFIRQSLEQERSPRRAH